MTAADASATPRVDAPRETFEALRRAFTDTGFDERGVCERLRIPTIYDFRFRHQGRITSRLDDGRDALVRLLMDAEPVARASLDELLPRGTSDALEILRLARPDPRGEHRLIPTVLLYPTESLYVISDLPLDPANPHAPYEMPADAVYPALTHGVRTFLDDIPTDPCDAFLELCSGTGIAALRAARSAGHAWAVDIADRSTTFATFNARLNGIDNATALTGDLYDPVRDLTFDRIVAHPPYVPSSGRSLIYRDGGEDGEQVTRRILGGLAAHLRPGGRFHCTCVMTDRVDAPVETRVRGMIGVAEPEFDVVALTGRTRTPADLYESWAREGRMKPKEAKERIGLFEELRVLNLVSLTLLVARHAVEQAPLTLRKARGPDDGPGAGERLLERERLARSPA